jgi:hypothetical protein
MHRMVIIHVETAWSKRSSMADVAHTGRCVSAQTVLILAVLCAWTTPQHALACASCACGDPTLTVMGAEQPFAGRLRLSVEAQYRRDAVGRATVDRVELQELRTNLSVAYSPLQWLMLSLTLPVIARDLTDVTLARERLMTIGDIELYGRVYVFRDRVFAPTHTIGVQVGMRVPTGPLLLDTTGNYREPELQPGTGSFDPSAGVSYLMSADPWSVFVSEILYLPTRGALDFEVGMSWRGTHALQYQLSPALALRAGVNHRLDATSKHGAAVEPDSGGLIAFGAFAAMWTPVQDLVLLSQIQVPVLNALRGVHDEGIFASLGAVYDL